MNSQGAESYDNFAIEGTIDGLSEGFLKDLPSQVRSKLVKFDFARAGRINSLGIALLLRCFKEIRDRKKAEIHLVGLSPMHTMLFKMTGVFLLASPIVQGASGKGSTK